MKEQLPGKNKREGNHRALLAEEESRRGPVKSENHFRPEAAHGREREKVNVRKSRPIPPSPKSLGSVHPLLDPPAPFLLLAPPGVILAANGAARALLQLSEQLVPRPSLEHFVAAEQVSAFRRFLLDAFGPVGELRGDFKLQLPQGIVPVQLICRRTQQNPIEGPLLRVLVLEQQETMGSQAWLKPNYEQEPLAGALEVVFWRGLAPFRFTSVSCQAQLLTGYPSAAWLNDPDFWPKIIHVDDRDRAVAERAQAVRNRQPHTLEYRVVRPDRSTIWVRERTVVEHADDGAVQLAGCMMDVSTSMAALEKLRCDYAELETRNRAQVEQLKQSVQAMETFCYGIAHDLRAPLRAMQGFQTMLFNQYGSLFDEEARTYAAKMSKAALHMDQLIKDLLTYGKINASAEPSVRIEPYVLLQEVVGMLQLDIKERSGHVEVQATLPAVRAQVSLLRQVFVNLIANALKFQKPGVSPEIHVTGMDFTRETAEGKQYMVRLAVSDNGIGVPERLGNRIFEVFQKEHPVSQYPGTGIGLSIVKRAVEIMGGEIGYHSEHGHGSTFWVDLYAG